MSSDSILALLPLRSASVQASIWHHTHVNPNFKYITLHSLYESMYIGNVYCFLTESLPNHSYINNEPATYVATVPVSFYIFTTNALNVDAQRCDNQYGYWKNNRTKIVSFNSTRIRQTYWYNSRNSKFRKQEFHLQDTVGDTYRGIMIYYRPIRVDVITDPKLVSFYCNSKSSIT